MRLDPSNSSEIEEVNALSQPQAFDVRFQFAAGSSFGNTNHERRLYLFEMNNREALPHLRVVVSSGDFLLVNITKLLDCNEEDKNQSKLFISFEKETRLPTFFLCLFRQFIKKLLSVPSSAPNAKLLPA